MGLDQGCEIVIALVSPIGTDVDMILHELETELTEYRFSASVHRLSDYLVELVGPSDLKERRFDEFIDAAMSAGDTLRTRWDRGDALALCTISDIYATRAAQTEYGLETGRPETELASIPGYLSRHAYILRSLKTPDEVETLRAVYGNRFVLVAAYSPLNARREHLREEIRRSRHNNDPTTWSHQPQDLIKRDWDEEIAGGQDVMATFQQADFFINAVDAETACKHIVRTLEVLFGHPFRTPTRDEFGLFAAQGAALKSAELGRQVGAAICSPAGAVISLGTNEVPKYGGGSHWEEDPADQDNREYQFGKRDTNRKQQEQLGDDVVQHITEHLEKEIAASSGQDALDQVQPSLSKLGEYFKQALDQGPLRDLTEFGRAVHAEMDALLDAARRGVSVDSATLYTTTFPCHNCARHIVAAGIERVVYVSPYAKSKAEELHPDSLVIAPAEIADRVSFEPFVGVAPRRYLAVFDAAGRERMGHPRRKDDGGYVQTFDKGSALPVLPDTEPEHLRPEISAYRQKELIALAHYEKERASKGPSAPPSTNAGTEETLLEDRNGGRHG